METAKPLDKLDAAMAKHGDILAAAVAKTLSAYNQAPTQANLRDYQANKKAYEEYKAQNAAGPVILNSKTEALKHLQEAGWSVKKSKLFDDLRTIPRTSGGWKASDLEKYAALRLIRANGADIESDTAEKIRQEIRVAAARAEKLEMENAILQGKYILRSEVEQLHAAKAHMIKAGLEDFFRSQAGPMVDICNGQPDRSADLREYCLRELYVHLHEYSRPCRYPAAGIEPEELSPDNET